MLPAASSAGQPPPPPLVPPPPAPRPNTSALRVQNALADPAVSSLLCGALFAALALLTTDYGGGGGDGEGGGSTRAAFAWLGFGACPPGAIGALVASPAGGFIASGGAATNLACLGFSVSALVFFAGLLLGLGGDLPRNALRRPALTVSVSIMAMSAAKYALVLADVTHVACYGKARRAFYPLHYAYWLCAAPPMTVMFTLMGALGEADRARSGLLQAGMVLTGLLSAATQALPSTAWRVASASHFALSCSLFLLVARLSHGALRGARSAVWGEPTRRLLLVAFPAGGALWLLFPFVALGARFGLLSPAAEAVVWPLLELSTKTCM